MGLLGDIAGIASSFAAASGAKKKNKELQRQYEQQQKYAGQQVDLSTTLAKMGQELAARGSGYTDAYGGTAAYDPVTGTWSNNLSAPQAGVQDASYQEELNRNTLDQTRRREGLIDLERLRTQASGESDQALRDMNNFKSGIGAVDASRLASTMRLNRMGAVNAGYDDAARAASTISMRTGASAGDALSTIARNRSRDIATQLGDPETDALKLAEGINTGRQSNLGSMYNMFNGNANKMYDASFAPSGYDATATDNNFKAQVLDLNKFDNATGAVGAGIGGIYGAAGGMRQAAGQKMQASDYNILGKLIEGVGTGVDSAAANIAFAAGGAPSGGKLNFAKLFG